jgi:hypothetical protein
VVTLVRFHKQQRDGRVVCSIQGPLAVKWVALGVARI